MPNGTSECPLCIGYRYLPDKEQREVLRNKLMAEYLNLAPWDKARLIDYFTNEGQNPWMQKVWEDSKQAFGATVALSQAIASADFWKIENSAPPNLRYYKYSDVGEEPYTYRAVCESAFLTRLLQQLYEFKCSRPQNMRLIGPLFLEEKASGI